MNKKMQQQVEKCQMRRMGWQLVNLRWCRKTDGWMRDVGDKNKQQWSLEGRNMFVENSGAWGPVDEPCAMIDTRAKATATNLLHHHTSHSFSPKRTPAQ